MLTLRLEPELESALEREAALEGRSKSMIVREAIEQYLVAAGPSSWEILREHLVTADTKETDLSTTYKTRLKKHLHEKHAH